MAQLNNAAAIPSTQPAPLLGPRIRLLSWNLHKGVDAGWQADLERLSVDRDLLFLQEFLPTTQAMVHTGAAQTLHFSRGFGRSGVATLSRNEALGHCGLRSPEPWLGTPKASTVTLHALSNGQTLLAINLHGVNFSVGSGALLRQLRALEPLLQAHRGPVIFGGDINAWNNARLRTLRRFMAGHALQEVPFAPERRSHLPGLLPMDYVFFRGLALQQASVVPVTSSDHNPLLVEWQL